MSFDKVVSQYDNFDFEKFNSSITIDKVRSILKKQTISELDFLSLLSDAAKSCLEEMAQRAVEETRKHFGNIIFIFTPLYISNHCENVCAYCSFARQHKINRRHLNFDEIRKEAENISKTGIRHILVLTGESKTTSSVEYIRNAVQILSEYFSTVSIEIYPLDNIGYAELISAGTDGLTIYQETYDKPLYEKLHKGGPKADYNFRVNAPQRACEEGIRSVTVGALLGLYKWRSEAFFTALHASYLQKKYPFVEVCASFPRLRPLAGEFATEYMVDDKKFVQMMTAYRIFMPTSGITVSTRESEQFRNSILPLGVTKMSAGVSTAVGSHSDRPSTTQFEIADPRSVDQMKADLKSMGFQAVMHDWNRKYVAVPKKEELRLV
jgi:2-iminoacetate synthase